MKEVRFKVSIFIPVFVFFISWFLGIICSSINVYYDSFVDVEFSLGIFFYCSLFFISPFILYSILYGSSACYIKRVIYYEEDAACNLLWRLFLLIAIIIIFNLFKNGMPPVFSFLGYDTKNYVEYGSLKQLLYSLLVVLMFFSVLCNQRQYLLFSFFIFIAFVARGPLLTSCVSLMIFMFVIRKIKIKTVVFIFMILMLLNSYIGELRTGKILFLQYMNIRPEKYDWDMSLLWMISYIATPFSNMMWIIKDNIIHGFGLSLIEFLPGSSRDGLLDSTQYPSKIIDGVHGYLTPVFNDYGFVGIAFFNFMLGFVFCYLHRRGSVLTFSYLIGLLSFLFFYNSFLQLTTVLSIMIFKYSLRTINENTVILKNQ